MRRRPEEVAGKLRPRGDTCATVRAATSGVTLKGGRGKDSDGEEHGSWGTGSPCGCGRGASSRLRGDQDQVRAPLRLSRQKSDGLGSVECTGHCHCDAAGAEGDNGGFGEASEATTPVWGVLRLEVTGLRRAD